MQEKAKVDFRSTLRMAPIWWKEKQIMPWKIVWFLNSRYWTITSWVYSLSLMVIWGMTSQSTCKTTCLTIFWSRCRAYSVSFPLKCRCHIRPNQRIPTLEQHLFVWHFCNLWPFSFATFPFNFLFSLNFLCIILLKQNDFWTDTQTALKNAYQTTDKEILEQSFHLGKGGSTAVTAILINGQKLVVANVGDSRAIISRKSVAKQLSVDHEPSKEKRLIESKGGFVSNLPGTIMSALKVRTNQVGQDRFSSRKYLEISYLFLWIWNSWHQ